MWERAFLLLFLIKQIFYHTPSLWGLWNCFLKSSANKKKKREEICFVFPVPFIWLRELDLSTMKCNIHTTFEPFSSGQDCLLWWTTRPSLVALIHTTLSSVHYQQDGFFTVFFSLHNGWFLVHEWRSVLFVYLHIGVQLFLMLSVWRSGSVKDEYFCE